MTRTTIDPLTLYILTWIIQAGVWVLCKVVVAWWRRRHPRRFVATVSVRGGFGRTWRARR